MTINTRLEFDGAVANNARLQQVLDQLGGAISSLNGGSIGSPLTIVGPSNNMVLSGSSTGNPITLTATGSDSNVGIALEPKGTIGFIKLGSGQQLRIGLDSPEQTDAQIDQVDFNMGRLPGGGNPVGFHQDLDVGPTSGVTSLWGIQSTIGTQGITHNVNKLTGWEIEAVHNGSSSFSVSNLAGVRVFYGANNSRVVTDAYGVDIQPSGGNALVNQYAINIGDVSGATTLNFAIKTALGKIQFGDVVNLQNLSASQVVVTDASKNLTSVAGTTTTVTTASLVGKTMTFTNGILTSFA